MNGRDPLQLPMAGLLAGIAVAAWFGADSFGMELLAEVAILAIFAMSLDLLVGAAGMVSLGHAGFLALGAYATAAATVLGAGRRSRRWERARDRIPPTREGQACRGADQMISNGLKMLDRR